MIQIFFILSSIYMLSCNFIDISPVTISVNPAQSYSIIKNSKSLYLRFSDDMNKKSVESITSIRLANKKIDVFYVWENAKTLYVYPSSPLKKGLLYSIISSGKATTTTEKKVTIEIFRSFYYQEKGSPIQITSIVDASNKPLHSHTITDVSTKFTINFSTAIKQSSFLNTFSISPNLEHTITWKNEKSVIINPKKQWKQGTKYTITINKDLLAKNNYVLLEPYSFTFFTNKDITPPVITTLSPALFTPSTNTVTSLNHTSLKKIRYSDIILITFSENIDPRSISESMSITPTIKGHFLPHKGNQAIFLHEKSSGWDIGVEYLLTINTSLTDTAGNKLYSEYRSRFTANISHTNIKKIKMGSLLTNLIDETKRLNDVSKILKIIPNSKDNNSYFFELEFSKKYTGVYKTKIENAITITPIGKLSSSPRLASITWDASDTKITIKYNKFGIPTQKIKKNIYKIIISKGKNTKNQHGSYLKEDYYLYFYIIK